METGGFCGTAAACCAMTSSAYSTVGMKLRWLCLAGRAIVEVTGGHRWRRFRDDGTIVEKFIARGLRNGSWFIGKVVRFPIFSLRNACLSANNKNLRKTGEI